MQKHCDNAKAVAEFLAGHPTVAAVNYAGLPGDTYNNLAREIPAPKGAGAVFTFSLKGGYDAGVKLVSNGETVLASGQCRRHPLAGHPPRLDHPQPARRRRQDQSGAAPDVVRLSIGIEDKDDLIADLEQALNA